MYGTNVRVMLLKKFTLLFIMTTLKSMPVMAMSFTVTIASGFISAQKRSS